MEAQNSSLTFSFHSGVYHIYIQIKSYHKPLIGIDLAIEKPTDSQEFKLQTKELHK